jgi:hypothetical protein
MTNDGQSFEYHVPNAIYGLNSPFNILGTSFIGDFFRSGDVPQLGMMKGPTSVPLRQRLDLYGTMAGIHKILLMMLTPYQY